MNPPTVLVLGAAGRFGAAAVDAFAASGWRVLAQQRRSTPDWRSPAVLPLRIPMADTATLAAAAQAARVVVYAVNPIYTRWTAELLPLFQQGIAVAERLGARFMLPGTVYNFGERMPPLLTEDTPPRPTTLKGRQRVALEELLERRASRGLDSVVIRAGDFFGAGTGNWFDQAIAKDLFTRGRLVYPGPMGIPHAWAYLPDLARSFVAVATRPAVPGLERLHFAGHTFTGQQLLDHVQAAAASLGLRPAQGFRRASMPWALIRAGGLLHPMWRELSRMSYLWRVPHRLHGHAPDPQSTPAEVAIWRALAALKQNGPPVPGRQGREAMPTPTSLSRATLAVPPDPPA